MSRHITNHLHHLGNIQTLPGLHLIGGSRERCLPFLTNPAPFKLQAKFNFESKSLIHQCNPQYIHSLICMHGILANIAHVF